MNVLIIGGGGREHAVAVALKKSRAIAKLYCMPGNGGTCDIARNVDINPKNIPAMVQFVKTNSIGFVVVTPDDPLALGAVDALNEAGVPCFGPTKAAAEIESSKVFAKRLMKKYGIPTAKYEAFSSADEANNYIAALKHFPVVIKADGLALGKGVVIAKDAKEAKAAVNGLMVDKRFGASGAKIIIEEFLEGTEVSVLAFTDGETLVPLISSMDHKRAFDGDRGENTGGMGAVAPNPFYTKSIERHCMERIYMPTVRAMNAEGRRFKGILYFGLMLTKKGPYVIEYNARFGDPETQAVLPLMQTDLFTVMRAVEEERLLDVNIRFFNGASCCVVLACEGYPKSYEKGKPIEISPVISDARDVYIYHAGTEKKPDGYITAGGRVINVVAVADTLESAVEKAYAFVPHVAFSTRMFRRDIGDKAVKEELRLRAAAKKREAGR